MLLTYLRIVLSLLRNGLRVFNFGIPNGFNNGFTQGSRGFLGSIS